MGNLLTIAGRMNCGISLASRAVARGRPVVPAPHLKSVPLHFTFGSPVAAYIQYCILKLWPPSGFWPLFLAFGPPLLLNPGDGPAGGPQKLINFILKLYLYLPKENKEENYVKERETSPDLLSMCLLIMEFHFDARFHSNFDAGHIKFSCGPQVPHAWTKSNWSMSAERDVDKAKFFHVDYPVANNQITWTIEWKIFASWRFLSQFYRDE